MKDECDLISITCNDWNDRNGSSTTLDATTLDATTFDTTFF